LVNLKTKSSGDDCPKKAIEKTILRFLGSHTFHTAWTQCSRLLALPATTADALS
jgi:hypothetical protein